jgi:adenosine kinase
MKTLICGSIAYDSIMVFQGRFKDHILPDQMHILNVSFLVPTLRKEFGGIAGNIAYNLALLQGEPVPVGTVGDDGVQYLQRFDDLGIDRRCVLLVPGTHTAQAFITTDLDDNQISAFHPGAMEHSSRNRIPEDPGIGLALVGPEGREGMLTHARTLSERGIPFVFDPGQAMPLLGEEELLWFVDRARYVAMNDYEAKLFSARTGRDLDTLGRSLEALVITHGARGSEIRTRGKVLSIPPAPAGTIVDPTGCGDAFRGGLLHGIAQGMDWETAGRLASLMGAIKIEHHGGQKHAPTRDQIEERFHAAFAYRPW